MHRRALLLAPLALAGRKARAAEAEIAIENFVFTPATLTVKAGTTVTWVNRDDIPHLVIAATSPPAFRSAALDTDDRYAFVFDRPGRYPYFCALHPHMQGTVVVDA
jgi:plastocyanin